MKSLFSLMAAGALVALLAGGCSDETTAPEILGGDLTDGESVIDFFGCRNCPAEGIIFSRNLDDLLGIAGRSEIYLWNGQVAARITDNQVRNESPVWVPFKRCFINVTRQLNYYLEIVCADGSYSTPLFTSLPDDFNYISPSISADGRQICFIKRLKTGGFTGNVVVYDADKKTFREYGLRDLSQPMTAKISPNGRYIACTTLENRVALIETSSGSVRLLTSVDSGCPAFSPNSRQVVYSQKNPENQYVMNLWLQDVCTGNYRQLTHEVTVKDFDACFSPDGERIVFARRVLPDYGSDTYHLWILNLYDMSLVQITDGDEDDRDPHWR